MNITKNSQLNGVDKVLCLRTELAYVKENTLFINDNETITLPEAPHLVSEPLDNYNVYISGQELSDIHKVDKDNQLNLLNKKKADGFVVISSNQFILVDEEGERNTLSYYQDGVLKWRKPKEKKSLSYNHRTIITSPHYKYPYLEVRDLATFTVQKVIENDENFKVSHHTNVIGDCLIFFQQRSIQGSPHLEVIATAINLVDSSIMWTKTYQGAHWFLFNDTDKQLYSFYGVWENKLKTMYLETIDPITGEHTKEKIVCDSKVSSIPWLTKTVDNIMYIADSDAIGTCIHALDLTTKKLIARCDLKLSKGVKIAEPYIAGDDLWVLDTEKTLHQLRIA
jgi:hypothetical protein